MKNQMLSLRTGNWFLAPMYVLGSADMSLDTVTIYFQRNMYEKLKITVMNAVDDLLLKIDIEDTERQLSISTKDWKKGEYTLLLEDIDKVYSYKINK